MSAEIGIALATVCRVLEAPRSTVYARRAQLHARVVPAKRGPKTRISDDDLVALIRAVIAESPFAGEGHAGTLPESYDDYLNTLFLVYAKRIGDTYGGPAFARS